jgi:hypothetical protein
MRAASRIGRGQVLLPAALFATIVFLTAPTPADAAWPNAPALNLTVCNAAAVQDNPVLAPDGVGGQYIAWEDLRSGIARIYAQHILGSGVPDPAWPSNGVPVVTFNSSQFSPKLVSDGSRGAIVSWQDGRAGSYDIYAQHLITSGVDPAWPAVGRAVCTDPFTQTSNSITTDGAGGAILAWVDFRTAGSTGQDVYAQHLFASGTVDPAWPVNGRALVTAAGNQTTTTSGLPMVPDGAGGAIVVWADLRAANYDVYAQHVMGTGAVDPAWPIDGKALCIAAFNQTVAVAVEDGSGGAYVAWQDQRATPKIYAIHVVGSGAIAQGWPVDGLSTNTGIATQITPFMASDGAGGAICSWSDFRTGSNYDVYAQHLLPTGVDASWPADGLGVAALANFQYAGGVVSDGAGGAIMVFVDTRSGFNDLYAQHVLANGSLDARWPASGRAFCTAADHQPTPSAISDGAGGIVAAWPDQRSGANDIYAQRVARFGYLGTPEAEIASVKDVPNDQGGKVKLSWYASYLDTNNDPNLNYYEIYRSVPPNAAQAALRHGARLLSGPGDVPRSGEKAILAPSAATGAYFWELLYTQYASHFLPTYSYLASTAGDSTGAYNPRTAFMIVGRGYDPSWYWMSRPDSGYSVDNLPPYTPAPFTGQYSSGQATLHWDPNTETDFANYRLYRGTTTSFVPGPGNLVASPPDTGYADAAGAPYYYKLSAVDTHGNESGFALLTPNGVLDVPGGNLPGRVAFATPWPNPASVSARFALAMPRDAKVSLAIFDAGGRRMRELVSGSLPAGEHTRVWDLRDDAGNRVAPGLYFATLDVGGARITRRFAVMR